MDIYMVSMLIIMWLMVVCAASLVGYMVYDEFFKRRKYK